MEIIKSIPDIFIQFVIVLLFSLVIGLEQRRIQNEKDKSSTPFGTDRTFTFIGMLGFILFILEPHNLTLFIIGAIILGFIFGIYYFKKIQSYNAFGITKILVGLITYSLAPIVITQPKGVSILIVVSILILAESKSYFLEFSNTLNTNEFIVLAKFLIISGVILPILPTTPISGFLNISAYQIWLSLVVVSGISYFSYLLQKFVFKKSGLIISGILGGLYSSTATTVVLSRKSKERKVFDRAYPVSIILASGMMYVRILILMLIFNFALGIMMVPYFVILILLSSGTGIALYFLKGNNDTEDDTVIQEKNPLELKIAIIFSALFLFFSFLTNYTIKFFGESGLNVLSFAVGFTDIDPYLLNLFQGDHQIGINVIAKASLQAIVSNNILKTLYTLFLAEKETKKLVLLGMGLITLVNIIIIFLMPG